MSDTPEGASGASGGAGERPDEPIGGASSGPGAGGAGMPPPGSDPYREAQRRDQEAYERARAAREAARDARHVAREARRAAWRASYREGGTGPTVIGIDLRSGGPVTPRIVFGLIFVTLGVLWTLDNFGVLDSHSVLRFWPLAVIAFGLMKMTGTWARRNPLWGSIWFVLGCLWLLDSLAVMHFSIGMLWPLALVAFGVMFIRRGTMGPVLIGGRIGRRDGDPGEVRFSGREGVHFAAGDVRMPDDTSDRLEMFSIWSHVDRRVISQSFRHGEVGALMGGIRLDLRAAKTAPEGAVIDLAVVWGGVDIVVPPGMHVVNDATVLMGGITDNTLPGSSASGDKLILRGAVVMGGVELKSA